MGDLGEDDAHYAGRGQQLATPASVKSMPGYALLPRLYRRLFMPDASVYWNRTVMDRETRELVPGCPASPTQRAGAFRGLLGPHRAVQDVPIGSLSRIPHLLVRLERAVRPHLRGAGVRAPALAVLCGKACVSNDSAPAATFSMTPCPSGSNSRSAGRLFALDRNRHPILSGRVWLRTGADPDRFLGKYRLRPRQLCLLGSVPCWRHSLHNEPNFPCSVWAFAQK